MAKEPLRKYNLFKIINMKIYKNNKVEHVESSQFYKKYKIQKTKSYKEYTDKQIIDAFNLIMSRYSHLNARAIEVDCLVNEINKRFDVSAIPEITENNDRYINYLISIQDNKIFRR